MTILEFKNVSKVFPGEIPVHALSQVSIRLDRGCFAALIGASGSGKSTLLNLASGLDSPTSGEVIVANQNISILNESQLSLFRRKHLGFIFQSYNLLPTLNVLENVEYTMLLRGDDPNQTRKLSLEALEKVGLIEKITFFPQKLSGGQQQRVAIARAIASKPEIIFADEPTANLDSETAKNLIQMFQMLNKEAGVSFLFSTHDSELIQSVGAIIHIKSGQVV